MTDPTPLRTAMHAEILARRALGVATVAHGKAREAMDEAAKAHQRHCRVCGCTDLTACDPPCWWVAKDLCSACSACAPEGAENPQ